MKAETIVGIIDARRAGKTRKEVATSFGVHAWTVAHYDAHLRWADPEKNLIRVRILKAWSEREQVPGCFLLIARELGCDHGLVSRVVHAHETEKAARAKAAVYSDPLASSASTR